MANDLKVHYLSYDDLRSRAASFRHQYHTSGSMPVPIEQIVELTCELDIVPVPGLQHSFGVDAFIKTDMTTICVDEYMYSSVGNRYRFGLAHELAHAVLHQKTYRSLESTDLASWKAAQGRIPEKDHRRLEWQAYAFAGLILVPTEALRDRFSTPTPQTT